MKEDDKKEQSFCSMDEPKQLIKHEEGRIEIVEETAQYLSNIRVPIIVIGISGFVGSGKSYLLNRENRLFYEKKGFKVGKKGEACTKGMWVWTRPTSELGRKGGEDSFTFLLDTEGLGNPRQEVNYDSALFSLLAILSSYFVYNSFGNINDRSIQQLQLILNLPTCVVNSEDFKRHIPPLLWLLRDHSLEDINTTSREYLDTQLDVRKGIDINSQTLNFITRRITGYFQDRDCFALARPILAEDINDLSQVSHDELNPAFNEQMDQLIQNIILSAPIKTIIRNIDGTQKKLYKMNGPAFVALARDYVRRINTSVSFKVRPKDLSKQDLPIYERAMSHLDSQIQLNVTKYEDEEKKPTRPKKEPSERRPDLLESRERVTIVVQGDKPVQLETEEDKEREAINNKGMMKRFIGEPLCGGFLTIINYAKYVIGVLILITIVVVLLVYFFF